MAHTLTCSIELSKSAGVTLTVTNEDGGITQTLVMDGTTVCVTVKAADGSTTITQGAADIQLEVAGPEATSTVRQTQDRVAIRCRSLEIEADEIMMKSSGDTLHEAGGKLTAKSAGDMALSASGRCSVSSTGDMTLDARANLTAAAAQRAKLSANSAAVEAATQLKADGGAGVAISSKMKLDLSAVQTILQGDAIATVRGGVVQVTGTPIKLG